MPTSEDQILYQWQLNNAITLGQIENFLKEHQEAFGINNIHRVKSTKTPSSFEASDQEKLAFNFNAPAEQNEPIILSIENRGDNKIAVLVAVPAVYEDLEKDMAAQRELRQYNNVIANCLLKFTPGNTNVDLTSNRPDDPQANAIATEVLQGYTKQFQEKGISVTLDGKPIIAPPTLDSPPTEHAPKPWDVPKGAPGFKPKE